MISLRQYMELQKLQKKYNNNSDKLGIEILKLFKGEDLGKIQLKECLEIIDEINKEISNVDLPLVHRFDKDGVQFGFIPNLEDISVGEFIDLDTLLQQEDIQLDQIMSVLYRPVKKSWFSRYSIEDYTGSEKYLETFLKTDFKIALGALFFFYTLKKSLSNHIITFIPEMMKKTQTK